MAVIPHSQKILIGLAIFCVFISGLSFGIFRTQKSGLETVVEVVDGDTFFIANRQPIRLYGVDAPALPNCFGAQAHQELTRLVSGRQVQLSEPLSDHSGRIMALVYVDGESVNEHMIRGGFAMYKRQGGSETQAMKQANEYARSNSIGIFSPDCYQPAPPDPKCAIKGNYDDHRRAREYLPPGCPFYSQVIIEKFMGEQWFCTPSQAQKAGYILSPTCK